MYKKLGIFLVVFVTSFWFWVVAKKWVEGASIFRVPSNWIPTLALLIALSSIFAVALIVMYKEKFETRWALAWLVGFTYLIVFGFTLLNLAGIAGIVLISTYGIKISEIELRDRTKIHIGLVLRRAMPAITVPLLISLSFSYYQSPTIQDRLDNKEVPVTVKTAVTKVVDALLENEPVPEVDSAEKEKLIDDAFKYMRDSFFTFSEKYGNYFPPVLAFGLFLILWGGSFIFVYLSLWLGMLIFWILKRVGFVKIQDREVVAQELIL